ncbi:bifunctional DNA primase/polymerase [Roseibacterium sp. SDUM158016]|uniref:bifunctional DNA primase/polymerase n=1 Tax=Roseicyclus sediminis TaxID=2980997 RepID=UPI0021D3D8EC|nr:bifunctional DNA primase/polymerase [Roseibacterium sp. SDUM158016]MCU4654492.1 bifunctional DNA primase/polymerase [Roseibacterium sp. SDUM158016]
MDRAPYIGADQQRETDDRAVGDRPVRAGHPTYGEWAQILRENGYGPLPIKPGAKKPAPARWTSVTLDEAQIAAWQRQYPDHGIGLRTGRLVGIDIDILDPDLAHRVEALARRRFGDTLRRVGLWPKRVLLYRTETPFGKMSAGKVEVLGQGQQVLAFGIHPDTGRQYYWPDGETPLDVPIGDLPQVDADAVGAFVAEARALQPDAHEHSKSAPRTKPPSPGTGPVRDDFGIVVEGRDGWLSSIAFHVAHDAIEAGLPLDAEMLGARVWHRFVETTDVGRPRKDGAQPYREPHARAKVRDKLRLYREGRLKSRDLPAPEPAYDVPALTVGEARDKLDKVLSTFCERVFDWHRQKDLHVPALAIRATVGLGKSHASRRHLMTLAERLRQAGLPSRLLVFVAGHALAEEAAGAWRRAGANVAVHRGYDRDDPVTGEPMCRDREAVTAAHQTGLSAQEIICAPKSGARCRFFSTCLKQRNRDDVAAAQIVISPYDTLFSGLPFNTDDIALMVVDEACWPRALETIKDIHVEDLMGDRITDMGGPTVGRGPVGAMADLHALRQRAVKALQGTGPGHVNREALNKAELTAEDCRQAARLEEWRKTDPLLSPALTPSERKRAFEIARQNQRIDHRIAIWRELGALLESNAASSGRLKVTGGEGRARIELRRVRPLHESLRNRPVLHLDATLRPELAGTILRGLEKETIEAEARHMHVRLVIGSFGKSMLCPQEGLRPEEARRRENRLRECVDYVRWQALRHGKGGTLVITYKAIEEAFAGIPNVSTLHFNNLAGLDAYKDVACLIVIGRPLPSSFDLEADAGGYFRTRHEGGYATEVAGIRMRDRTIRGVRVIRHRDETAEDLRAAICDDELIQAIGRGRGVNRTADNPLEVHVLADVALPLVYDVLQSWDAVKPHVMQQMLLAGVAVDSPADAAALYPGIFANENTARMAFERAGFKGQNPMYDTYREMTLKSAAYRRDGRGRGWQRAWWFERDEADVREQLELCLGRLSGWSTADR